MNALIILSPFIFAGAVLAILFGIERYNRRRYERKVEKRNAKCERLGLTPFRGTKEWNHDDLY
jgi:hypothetical protein